MKWITCSLFSTIFKAVPRSGELHRLGIPPGERSWSVGSSTFISSKAGWSCKETFWLKQLKMPASILEMKLFSVKHYLVCRLLQNRSLESRSWLFFVLVTHFPFSKYNIVWAVCSKRSGLYFSGSIYIRILLPSKIAYNTSRFEEREHGTQSPHNCLGTGLSSEGFGQGIDLKARSRNKSLNHEAFLSTWRRRPSLKIYFLSWSSVSKFWVGRFDLSGFSLLGFVW